MASAGSLDAVLQMDTSWIFDQLTLVELSCVRAVDRLRRKKKKAT